MLCSNSMMILFILLGFQEKLFSSSELLDSIEKSNGEWRYEYPLNVTKNKKIFGIFTNEMGLRNHVPFFSNACDKNAISVFYLDQSPEGNNIVFMLFVEASNWIQLSLGNSLIYENSQLIRQELLKMTTWDKREWVMNVQATLDYFRKKVLRRHFDLKYDLPRLHIQHESQMAADRSLLFEKMNAFWKSVGLSELLKDGIHQMVDKLCQNNLDKRFSGNIRFAYTVLW